MKKIFIVQLFLLLLVACSEENTVDSTPTVTTPTSTETETVTETSTETANPPVAEEEPIMNSDSLTPWSERILQALLEKISPITDVSGSARTSFLRTIDGEMDSTDINTTFTLTDIGKYAVPFEGDVHYKVQYNFEEPASQEGYYFPYDYWYKNSSWFPMWHRENLADYEHESEGVQHGFHPSPQKMLTTLSQLTDISHPSLDDPEQDLVEIGFELNADVHAEVMDELFLHPVEYHSDFFDASRCWHYTDSPSYVYVVVQPEANELLSIGYFTEMYCDIIEATMEISSTLSYDFDANIEKVSVPKDIIEEAEAEELGVISPFDENE